jgi:signal transduction histidine kinase
MALSIGFSVAIYNISVREIVRSTPQGLSFKPIAVVQGPNGLDIKTFRDEWLAASQSALLGKLVWLNIGTLVVGAAVSYALARRTLKPIEEAFIAQGRFTADASHELRTPLTAMRTSLEVGLRNPKMTLKDSKQLMRGTLDEIQKLSTLANGLLKLTRSDGQEMPKDEVDISIVLEESKHQLQLAADNKHITITTIPAEGPILVAGDAISLKELVVILLDNAIKYSDEQTMITLSAVEQGKQAVITVEDQGQGIKASDIPHIFDRFYRADTSRSRDHIEGYGLGLPIAQSIAQAHGGTISVKSTPSDGSTFIVSLPLA